jgi:teichuronic acid biosynthesis glycosyltransferase TuaG
MPPTYTDLVSIITPAFNAASFIGETIKSVIAQTYPNWEMIIAEDCSPDDTLEVIRQWALVEPRIKLVAMDFNGGPALARNAALKMAEGRWIAFLDSDDLWLSDKLERSISHAQEYHAALVFTGFRRITADGYATGHYVGVPRTLTYHQLLGNTAIATSTVLLDRNVVGDVRMKKTYYDDFDCWLQILKRGHLAFGLNEDLMRYRVLNQSVSRNKWRSALHTWRAYRNLEKLNIPMSFWYFSHYAIRALIKYRKF